jgi:L-rhamnose mutarotase
MMGALQKTLPWAAPGEKWAPAACIFDLAEHG